MRFKRREPDEPLLNEHGTLALSVRRALAKEAELHPKTLNLSRSIF